MYVESVQSLYRVTNLLRLPYDIVRPLYEMTSIHRAVIAEIEEPELQQAYSLCRAITREHAKTFYLSTRFLPNHKQRSIFAIYALCRYVDDLVDEAEDCANCSAMEVDSLEEKLGSFKKALHLAYQEGSSEHPILLAFADTVSRFNIPQEYPLLLMKGVGQDLTIDRIQTFQEMYDYSYKVASVVGLMTSEVFGYDSPDALPHAVDLGIAMQLTNILRDVGEDLDKGRIYLPADELAKFGVSEASLFAHKRTPEFIKLMQFQIERARSYYESAVHGIAMLHADSRLPVCLALENYSRILDKIEQNDYDVFSHRAHLTLSQKLEILPRVYQRIKERPQKSSTQSDQSLPSKESSVDC